VATAHKYSDARTAAAVVGGVSMIIQLPTAERSGVVGTTLLLEEQRGAHHHIVRGGAGGGRRRVNG
jgi:hypothetical protein